MVQVKSKLGTLYMLATHLGNKEDIPLRSIATLKEADLLVFEEDRPARAALKAAKLHREYLKFSEHIQKETLEQIKLCLQSGQTVAYMSDQGCPTFADPGRHIVELAMKLEANIKVIPGPSSLTAAISACPFPLFSFQYLGFLPRQDDERMNLLAKSSKEKSPLVILDTLYRLKQILESCSRIFPKGRLAFLAMDITGEQETYIAGTFKKLLQKKTLIEKKLNFVLIVSGES